MSLPRQLSAPPSARSLRRHCASITVLTLAAILMPSAHAELQTVDVSFKIFNVFFNNIPSVTARARLDFTINIDKMVYLRVGAGGSHAGGASGSGPAASASVSTAAISLVPSVVPGGTITLAGSNQSLNWGGAAPGFTASAAATVPVEVRSNAGQVSITGQATTPLTSGPNTIPMSSIAITSSDASLPAPTVPNSGAGPAVNVATGGSGTGAAPTLLTYRQANWSFGYTAPAAPAPGTYNGAITFTASVL